MSHCIYSYYHQKLIHVVTELFPQVDEESCARIELTPSRSREHGDMASNAAMILARIVKKNPRIIAQEIADKLSEVAQIEKVEVAGPGFINVTLGKAQWQEIIPHILNAGTSYGTSDFGRGHKVNVEYVSANPTGPLHVGHCRGAIVGDVLASILNKTGFSVTREFYVNDAGVQVKALAWASYWRYLQVFDKDFPGEIIQKASPVGLQYGGDYLIEVGQALADKYGRQFIGDGERRQDWVLPPSEWIDIIQKFTVDYMLDLIKDDLRDLGVVQDQFTSESQMLASGEVKQALDKLKEQHHLYKGVLPPPKGKKSETWESREQLLFRSTDFGDDQDRPLQKPDGNNTYFANDIGYHYDKIKRGFKTMIDVWGADHGGYIKRLKAAVAALSDNSVPLEILLCQIVHILRDGEVVRMSKRAGTFVTVRELIDEVGRDAIRFAMLTRRSDAQMNFDLAEIVAQKRENPIFYVQYAHARCRSVLRAAEEAGCYGTVTPQILSKTSLESLCDHAELDLIKRLAQWPRLLQSAAATYEPHRIAFYLLEVAADFHALWNQGKENTTLRFLQEDQLQQTRARLALVWASVIIIRSAFEVMGVTPIEEMR